jgi:hypothetical protein
MPILCVTPRRSYPIDGKGGELQRCPEPAAMPLTYRVLNVFIFRFAVCFILKTDPVRFFS